MSDSPIRVVDVGGYRVGVFAVFRPKSIKQESNLHQTRVAEVYYILDPQEPWLQVVPSPTESLMSAAIPTLVGTRIEGGVSRRVSKGDVIIFLDAWRTGGATSNLT